MARLVTTLLKVGGRGRFHMVVKGKIEWISGPAVKVSGMAASKMYEVVEVGEEKLVGEGDQTHMSWTRVKIGFSVVTSDA